VLNPWYVTGFCEGEAAFTYSRSGRSINLYFSIKLRADDKDVIAQLYDFFRVGTIYRVRGRLPTAHSGYTRQALYYRTSRVSQIERIVQHFDKYPLAGKKRASYRVWKKMFLLKKNFRKPDFEMLNELALKLSSVNSKNSALTLSKEN